MNKIIQRIEREAGVPGLASILAERLAPTDLQSLLLEVYRLRSKRRRPSAVLSDYQTDRFLRPSTVSPRRLLSWDRIAFSCLPPEFEPLALSPVAPLGSCSVVAGVDQNWVVSTIRNSEVVSNPTNVLALECSLRRRALLRADRKSTQPVHLAASHRLLRAQHYQDPRSVSHFSAFALCSAGRDQGSLRFELSALALHIRFYLKALRMFLGPSVPLRVALTDLSSNASRAALEDVLLSPVQAGFEGVDCIFDDRRTTGRAYYVNLCFHIYATDSNGRPRELVDGGCVDWTRSLVGSAKERLVISGIGSERLCSEFEISR